MNNKVTLIIIMLTKWLTTFGSYLQAVALPIIIYTATGSAELLSWTFFAETLPWLVVAPWFTKIVINSFSVKRAYILTNIFRGSLTFLLAFSMDNNVFVIIIFFFLGILNSIAAPLYSMLIKDNTNGLSLGEVLGISLGIDDVVSIVAPLVVSFVITVGGNGIIFIYINGVMLIMNAFLSTRIVSNNELIYCKKEKLSNGQRKIREELLQLGKGNISYMVVSETCRSFVEGMCIPLFVVYVVSVIGAKEEIFTIGETMQAIAQVIMSGIYIIMKKKYTYNGIISVGAILISMALGLLCIFSHSAIYIFAMVLFGAGMAIRQIVAENLLISSFDGERLSNMVSLYNAVIALAYLMGYLLSAVQNEIATIQMYNFCGMLIMLIPFIFFNHISRKKRKSDGV